MFKKILGYIFNPIKSIANKNVSEKISVFFSKHTYLIYILTGLVVLTILFFVHFYPQIIQEG